jgi:hypothetical protein
MSTDAWQHNGSEICNNSVCFVLTARATCMLAHISLDACRLHELQMLWSSTVQDRTDCMPGFIPCIALPITFPKIVRVKCSRHPCGFNASLHRSLDMLDCTTSKHVQQSGWVDTRHDTLITAYLQGSFVYACARAHVADHHNNSLCTPQC